MTFELRRIALSRLFPTLGFQIIIESRSTEDLPGYESDKCLLEADNTANILKCKFYFEPFPQPGSVCQLSVGGLRRIGFNGELRPDLIRNNRLSGDFQGDTETPE